MSALPEAPLFTATESPSLAPGIPSLAPGIPSLAPVEGRYELAFVRTAAELEEVFRLRYEVFNLELDEGLVASHETGLDRDEFDAFCHHLVVRDRMTGKPVGTYRMQTGEMAAKGRGFYTATLFDLSGLDRSVLDKSLEIGRACIGREHRSLQVLYLLWQGLGRYVAHNDAQFVFGCCSLTSQDPDEGTRVFRRLENDGHIDPLHEVQPLPSLACMVSDPADGPDRVPRLMRAYLSLGATICSQPALDREFGTIDFMALFDLARMDNARLSFYRCR
jgi:putative hemolysin